MAGESHAGHRAAERYGYDLTDGDERRLCVRLAFQDVEPTPDCVRVSVQPDGRERWIVWHRCEWMAVIYEPTDGLIVTFLPPTVVRDNKHKLPW